MFKKIEKIGTAIFYLLVFLLPIQTVWLWRVGIINGEKCQYTTMAFYGTEILVWLLAGFLVARLFFGLWQSTVKIDELKKYFWPVLFLIYTGVAIFWSTERPLAFYWWSRLAEGLVLLLFYCWKKIDPKKILSITMWSGAVQAVVVFYQVATQKVLASVLFGLAEQLPATPGTAVVATTAGRWLRGYGTLPHPNMLGGFLAVALMGAIYLSFFGRRKIVAVLATPILTLALALTYSRSAWLAFLIGLILFFAALGREFGRQIFTAIRQSENLKYFWSAILGLATTAIIFVIIFHSLVSVRFAGVSRLETKSTVERFGSWHEATVIIKNNFFFGVGPGNYITTLFQSMPSLPAWVYQPAHNLYLMIGAELGLVGLAIFLLMIISVFWRAYTRRDFYLVPFLVVLLVIGLFDHYLWTSYFGILLFWLVLTIIF